MAKAITTQDLHTMLILQGFITLLFGLAAIFWPNETLTVLLYLFGAYILVSGVLHIARGISGVADGSYWLLITLLGVVEVGFGIYMLRHPLITFGSLIALIGFILIIRGVIEMVSSIFSDDESKSKAMGVFMGLFSLVIGVIVLYQKQAAGIAFVWLIGLYAIIVGTLQLVGARELEKSIKEKN